MKILVILLFMTALAGSIFAESPDKTLKNLQKAYQTEMNAAYKYEQYASMAKQQGQERIARLFHAAAMSENIISSKHRKKIQQLGETPQPVVYEAVKTGSTKKNLKKAIKHEAIDNRYTYPLFINEAGDEEMTEVIECFTYANELGKDHERLFKEALSQLGSNIQKDYYVNNATGKIAEVPASAAVPDEAGKEFTKIDI